VGSSMLSGDKIAGPGSLHNSKVTTPVSGLPVPGHQLLTLGGLRRREERPCVGNTAGIKRNLWVVVGVL
jgi:hypothetical protein